MSQQMKLLIQVVFMGIIAVLWLSSYSHSLWLPVSLQSCGIQIHVWRGRAFILWSFERRGPPTPGYLFTIINDIGPGADDQSHPNLRMDRILLDALHRKDKWLALGVNYYVPTKYPGVIL
jgi:hypothetical protein